MLKLRMIVFFSIILGIHALVNFYIYKRAAQGIEAVPHMLFWLRVIIILLFVSYPLGRFLEKVWYSPIAHFFHWTGAFWFAGMLYFVIAIFSLDLIRWGNHLFDFLPMKWMENYSKTKLITTYATTVLVVLVVIIGHINAWTPKITRKTIDINKDGGEFKSLKIVAASDIHLGTIIGPRKTGKLVNTINSLKPDIILFAGDIVDEDIKPVIEQNLGKNLLNLKAPLGVYGITGNHEYIGGAEKAVKYLEEHGIDILRDTSILVKNSFYISGREDRDKTNFTGIKRKTPGKLTSELDPTKPIIMLDHQPYHLDLVENAGVDLQLSGHTHHGQLWPFNYITEKIFEVSSGYKKKGNSHFYVSNGFGTWGPPVRLGNRPEIIEFTLNFK
ncbi:metallophosphoesterase [Plebeiibacterium sediminum]|uniref:Metallophosphoesterase n=1 Tax=Plebeiibacterium sediminum TaxID=2992112 RepID=A0AAE3SIC1_9BACT|nr:metallophosphoesterase [Plebeiobacterium sediminum]MCW3789063.1 metallophosphoesterase [Plebeiobacterium sediminum]